MRWRELGEVLQYRGRTHRLPVCAQTEVHAVVPAAGGKVCKKVVVVEVKTQAPVENGKFREMIAEVERHTMIRPVGDEFEVPIVQSLS